MQKNYTCEEVAKMYRVKRRTVWAWLRSGKLSAVRAGKEYRISEADLKAFEAKNRK